MGTLLARVREEIRWLGLHYALGVESTTKVWLLDKRARRHGEPVALCDLASRPGQDEDEARQRPQRLADDDLAEMPPLAHPKPQATDLAFSDWPTVFPNATCATALIDRLVHHADVIAVEGESYRRREAEADKKSRRKRAAA